MLITRFLSRIRKFIDTHEDLTQAQLVDKALTLIHEIDITSAETGEDPVYVEAMSLAREMIEIRLASQNLPVPRNIDLHAEALLEARPDLLLQAKNRIEIKLGVVKQQVERLGIG